eukprot:363363-Chlamydomonas_euryale.AAC.3
MSPRQAAERCQEGQAGEGMPASYARLFPHSGGCPGSCDTFSAGLHRTHFLTPGPLPPRMGAKQAGVDTNDSRNPYGMRHITARHGYMSTYLCAVGVCVARRHVACHALCLSDVPAPCGGTCCAMRWRTMRHHHAVACHDVPRHVATQCGGAPCAMLWLTMRHAVAPHTRISILSAYVYVLIPGRHGMPHAERMQGGACAWQHGCGRRSAPHTHRLQTFHALRRTPIGSYSIEAFSVRTRFGSHILRAAYSIDGLGCVQRACVGTSKWMKMFSEPRATPG